MASLQLHGAQRQPLWAGGFQILGLGRTTLLSGQGGAGELSPCPCHPSMGTGAGAELGLWHCLCFPSPCARCPQHPCSGTATARDVSVPWGRSLSGTQGQQHSREGDSTGDREDHWGDRASQDMPSCVPRDCAQGPCPLCRPRSCSSDGHCSSRSCHSSPGELNPTVSKEGMMMSQLPPKATLLPSSLIMKTVIIPAIRKDK